MRSLDVTIERYMRWPWGTRLRFDLFLAEHGLAATDCYRVKVGRRYMVAETLARDLRRGKNAVRVQNDEIVYERRRVPVMRPFQI